VGLAFLSICASFESRSECICYLRIVFPIYPFIEFENIGPHSRHLLGEDARSGACASAATAALWPTGADRGESTSAAGSTRTVRRRAHLFTSSAAKMPSPAIVRELAQVICRLVLGDVGPMLTDVPPGTRSSISRNQSPISWAAGENRPPRKPYERRSRSTPGPSIPQKPPD